MGIWRFIDSADGFSAAQLTERYTSAGSNTSITAGFGGRKAYVNPTMVIGEDRFPGGAITSKRVVIGELIKRNADSFTSLCPWGAIISGSTTQLIWWVQIDGSILFQRPGGGGTTVYTTPAGLVRAGVWQHWALDIVVDSAVGDINVYLNNSLVAAAGGGLNTCNLTGGNNWTAVQRGGGGFETHTGQDYYLWNPNVGESLPAKTVYKIARVRLTGNGASTQFASGTANLNWQNVDDTTNDGDTSTNSSSSRGDIDLFTLAAISTGDTVAAYQISIAGRLADAGTAGLQIVQRQSATNYLENSLALGLDYQYGPTQLFENSPAGGSPADLSDATLSAMQVGYKDVDAP